MSTPVATHNVPREKFPITFEFIRESDGKVLHTTHVDSPGAMQIPGFYPTKVTVRITYGDGTIQTTTSDMNTTVSTQENPT